MFKEILDEARLKAEKVRDAVVADILKSKTLNQIVSNKNFLKAVSYTIETKKEIQSTINRQVKDLFKTLNVPHKKELQELGKKLEEMEKAVERYAAQKIPVKTLSHTKGSTKTTRKKEKISRKVIGKKKR